MILSAGTETHILLYISVNNTPKSENPPKFAFLSKRRVDRVTNTLTTILILVQKIKHTF